MAIKFQLGQPVIRPPIEGHFARYCNVAPKFLSKEQNRMNLGRPWVGECVVSESLSEKAFVWWNTHLHPC